MTTTLTDEFRFRFPSDQFYLKSPEAMYALFEGDEVALANSQKIADRCDFHFTFDDYHFPIYPKLEGRTPVEALRELASEGLVPRLEVVEANYEGEDWEAQYEDQLLALVGLGPAEAGSESCWTSVRGLTDVTLDMTHV